MSLQDLRKKITDAKDIKKELVEIKDWDVTLEARSITSKERLKIIEVCTDAKTRQVDLSKMYNMLIIAGTFEPETGEKVFTPVDITMLEEKSSGPIEQLAKSIMNLSGLSPEVQGEIIKK